MLAFYLKVVELSSASTMLAPNIISPVYSFRKDLYWKIYCVHSLIPCKPKANSLIPAGITCALFVRGKQSGVINCHVLLGQLAHRENK